MIKKLLNPIVVCGLVLVLVLGCVGHLFFGFCQTTKTHYMIQRYWMPENLPKWMWESNRYVNGKFPIDEDYTGVWRDWFENGTISNRCEYLNGSYHGTHEMWHENGSTSFKVNYSSGALIGRSQMWHENGNKNIEVIWSDKSKQLSMNEWDIDGHVIMVSKYDKKSKQYTSTYFEEDQIIKKEYSDDNNDFLKRELFEKGRIVKVEFKEYP